MGAADVPPFARLLLGEPLDCDPGLLGQCDGDRPSGGEQPQAASSATGWKLAPQELAFIEWLSQNLWWFHRRDLTWEENRQLVRSRMVEFGVIKRWADQ